MREIKFRAWDKQKHVFIYFSIDDMYDDRYGLFVLRNRSDFEIMQYTGFKDKNGKEIYEGDIIDYLDLNEDPCGVVWNEDKGGWWIDAYNDDVLPPLCKWNDEYKVIGNIYENPELLGESNDA